MKKIVAYSFLIIFLLMTAFACSGTNNICPAYSKSDIEQTDNQNG